MKTTGSFVDWFVAIFGVHWYFIVEMYYSFVKRYDDNNQSSFDLVMDLFYLMNNPSAFDTPYKYPNNQISQHGKKISKSLMSIIAEFVL